MVRGAGPEHGPADVHERRYRRTGSGFRTKGRGIDTTPDVMSQPLTKIERRALDAVRSAGVLRPSDLRTRGIPRSALYGLVR